jgi:hypothetical protein
MGKHKDLHGKSRFNEFISKAGEILPEVIGVASKLATGNIGGALEDVGGILSANKDKNEASKQLFNEFEKYKLEFSKECYELEVRDRESARLREVEIIKAGGFDFMMLATGIVGLLSFMFVIYAVVYVPAVKDNDLFIHLLGMIEGIVISNIFAYYYGTSVKK